MHPILARPGRVAAYVAIWVALGALLAAMLALQGTMGWSAAAGFAVPLAIAYGFICLSAYYAAHGLPVDRADPARIAVTSASAAFLSTAIWLLFARGWLGIIGGFSRWPDVAAAFRGTAPTLFGFGLVLYLLALAVAYLATTFEAARDAERRGLELQVFAREAELRALRAQLDPHFLFNSLQSISALTAVDAAGARRMCLLLADFLRDTLVLGARERIPLESELSLAARFLAIEQVRFGSRLRVEIDPDGAAAALVPPLILQPLVENAVTHGIAHVLEGGVVRIQAAAGVTKVSVTVDNPRDPDAPPARGVGMGLANVRDRLRTSYGTEARLTTEAAPGRFVARVELPLVDSGS
jgi:hypothetical protein